ncbi:hypothetical protein ACQKP0_20270 [Heyndrickxia sp. NPDC080065]
MKSQRIPEHKLNTTTTVSQALENITNEEANKGVSSKKQNQNK